MVQSGRMCVCATLRVWTNSSVPVKALLAELYIEMTVDVSANTT